MVRYDRYGFRHMETRRAVSFVQEVLGIQFEQRDSSYSGLYYRSCVGPSAEYLIYPVGGEYELQMEYGAEYRCVLHVNDVPDMDGVRDKLIGGRGEPVLLRASIYPEDSADLDDDDSNDERPDNWTTQHDFYGFPSTGVPEVLAFVERVITRHYLDREGVLPRKRDLALGRHEKSYSVSVSVVGSLWQEQFPEYRVILCLTDLPDMHSLRAKLTADRGGVFLDSRVWAVFPSYPEEPARSPDGSAPAEPPLRHDVYGFGDMPLEEALFFVGRRLGIPVWERDGSFPGVYDSPDRCGGKSYELELSCGMAVWKARYPDHRAILVITDLPDMDAAREKLTGGSGGATFLCSETSEASGGTWWSPADATAPRESPLPRVRNEDDGEDDPSTENPILAVLRGPSIKLT